VLLPVREHLVVSIGVMMPHVANWANVNEIYFYHNHVYSSSSLIDAFYPSSSCVSYSSSCHYYGDSYASSDDCSQNR
jgi:hypothetical protein